MLHNAASANSGRSALWRRGLETLCCICHRAFASFILLPFETRPLAHHWCLHSTNQEHYQSETNETEKTVLSSEFDGYGENYNHPISLLRARHNARSTLGKCKTPKFSRCHKENEKFGTQFTDGGLRQRLMLVPLSLDSCSGVLKEDHAIL